MPVGMIKTDQGVLIPLEEGPNKVIYQMHADTKDSGMVAKDIYFLAEIETINPGNGQITQQIKGGQGGWEKFGRYFQGTKEAAMSLFEKQANKPPFKIPENPSRADLQEAIKNHLTKDLGFNLLSNEYSREFMKWWNDIRKQYPNSK